MADAKVTEAFVTPALIKWARERRRLSPEAAANKLKVKLDALHAWEQGTKHPTLRQAKELAHIFSVPFGYLYLSEPPQEQLPIPDLRTVSGSGPTDLSPEFIDVLNDVLRKQAWYRQELESQGAQTLTFIGRFKPDADMNIVAANIRDTLGLTDELRQSSRSWDDFLTRLTAQTEGIGVLVMRTGMVQNNTHRTLNVDEFRGFAISDDLAPIIFINGRDAKAAQIFTLAHELAHLWFGASGISNPNYRHKPSEQPIPVERASDAVAAETLVPEATFRSRWNGNGDIEMTTQRLAEFFRVSTIVVLRRAYELGEIDQQTFWDYYDKEVANRRPIRGTGGNYYTNVVASNSATITRAVITAVWEGRTSHNEAARLLNVAPSSLDGVSEKVFGGPIP